MRIGGRKTTQLATSGEADEASQRHALYYLVLAEEAEPNLVRAGHQDWFRCLDAERGNFRRATAWATGHGETVLALRYTAALWRYWRQLGEFTEGRRWTDAALSMAGDAPGSLRARALLAAAALAFPQGDYQRLAALVSEAMDLARRGEDPMDTRNALTIAGFVAVGQGRYPDALDAFGECVKICRRLGPSWQLATSRLNLGAALLHVGRPGDADAAFAAGLRIYRQLGDDIFAARMTVQRAQAALAQGRIDQAASLARDALAEFASHEEDRESRTDWKPWQRWPRHGQTPAAPPPSQAPPPRLGRLSPPASCPTSSSQAGSCAKPSEMQTRSNGVPGG